MATFALKVSVDGVRYAIQGVSKETSRKEILCTVAKFKTADQLADLQVALAKLDSTITLVKFQKAKENTREEKRGYTKRSKKATASSQQISTSEYDQPTHLCRRTTACSQSFNDKISKSKKQTKIERPRSFAAFDADKKITWNELKKYLSVPFEEKSPKSENFDERGARDDSDLEVAKASSRKLRNLRKKIVLDDADGTSVFTIKRKAEKESRKIRNKLKNDKLQNRFAIMKENLTTYFIDNQNLIEAKICKNRDFNNNLNAEVANQQDCCEVSGGKQADEDFAEGETDSGLPSIDCETSSLDTISRDELVSLEQNETDRNQSEQQDDSGFDCNSINDVIARPNFCSCTTLQDADNSSNVSGSRLREEEKEEVSASSLKQEDDAEDPLDDMGQYFIERILLMLDQISKIDEELLHKELLISQLEFQTRIVSEDFDQAEDYEFESDEEKLITDLEETEKFLTAITNLHYYQNAAEREMISELSSLEAAIKEKKLKLQSLEKRLLRRELKWFPKHLNVSDEKRRIITNMYLKEEVIETCNMVGDQAISLV
ncbi:uncharacterized protein LOC135695352 [Rhopilema esculentum]|uniref:uncharacterized protein LOC135695352 n=1 Tax=Rhopilema esculentum TaxID=499914 RepID=UPI0031DBC23B|eukprot:gene11673-21928_t